MYSYFFLCLNPLILSLQQDTEPTNMQRNSTVKIFLQLENDINILKFFPFHNKYDAKLVHLRYDLETLSALIWNI